MRKLSILLALVAGLFTVQAKADFTAKNATGSVITFKNPGDCTSVVCVPEQQIVDSTGTAVLGTTTDAVAVTPSTASAASLIALMKAINNNVSSAIPSQSPTVPIGGTSICDGANGATNPCTTAATVKAASTPAAATDKAIVVDQRPGTTVPVSAASLPLPSGAATAANQGLPYPPGATPLTASATGTTAATTATLAGTSAKTTYICSLSVRANATANTNVTNTVTGVITGTLSRAMWVPANTAGLGVDEQIYSPCVPASATNTAIAVVSGAPGTGGVVTVNATGYQL